MELIRRPDGLHRFSDADSGSALRLVGGECNPPGPAAGVQDGFPTLFHREFHEQPGESGRGYELTGRLSPGIDEHSLKHRAKLILGQVAKPQVPEKLIELDEGTPRVLPNVLRERMGAEDVHEVALGANGLKDRFRILHRAVVADPVYQGCNMVEVFEVVTEQEAVRPTRENH